MAAMRDEESHHDQHAHPNSILRHLQAAVDDKKLVDRGETVKKELEVERGLYLVDVWKDAGFFFEPFAVVKARLGDDAAAIRAAAAARVSGWLRRRRNDAARAARVADLAHQKRGLELERGARSVQRAIRNRQRNQKAKRIRGRRDLAALTLQGAWHRHRGRYLQHEVAVRAAELRRVKAVATIQGFCRRMRARKHIRQLRKIKVRRKEGQAARVVQRQGRIFFEHKRKEREARLLEEERQTAATTLQRKFRTKREKERWLSGLKR